MSAESEHGADAASFEGAQEAANLAKPEGYIDDVDKAEEMAYAQKPHKEVERTLKVAKFQANVAYQSDVDARPDSIVDPEGHKEVVGAANKSTAREAIREAITETQQAGESAADMAGKLYDEKHKPTA